MLRSGSENKCTAKNMRGGSGTTNCVSNWVFGDCSRLPSEAPKDERVVRFVGQPAGVVVRQTCTRLQMWQHMGWRWDISDGRFVLSRLVALQGKEISHFHVIVSFF